MTHFTIQNDCRVAFREFLPMVGLGIFFKNQLATKTPILDMTEITIQNQHLPVVMEFWL